MAKIYKVHRTFAVIALECLERNNSQAHKFFSHINAKSLAQALDQALATQTGQMIDVRIGPKQYKALMIFAAYACSLVLRER